MAAPSSMKEATHVEDERGKRRNGVRRSRSSSIGNANDLRDPASLSPLSRRSSRANTKITTTSRSHNSNSNSISPSQRRRQTISRSNSRSKKEQIKEKAAQRSSRSRSKGDSRDRSDSTGAKGKSYLSQRPSAKKESKGRKSSVLGSLSTFLDEESSKLPAGGRSRDAQSVISSASRRRPRSHTPSSASVVGGMSISREELRQQRRSSSAAPLERKVREGRRPNSHRKRNPSKEPSKESRSRESSSSRRRDSSKEHSHSSRDPRKPTSSSSRKENTRSRTRSSSVSMRGDRKHVPSVRTPAKSLSAGTKRGSKMDVSKFASPSKKRSDDDDPTDSNGATPFSEQAETSFMTLSNGADIPPGFPLAAVDSNQVLSQSGEEGTEGNDSGDDKHISVLDSTARLRERRAMSESITLMNCGPGVLDKGGEKTRRSRSRRRSILGSIQAAGKDATDSSQRHASQDPEDRRKSLRSSVSESVSSSAKKPAKRHSIRRSGSLSPHGRKESVVDALQNNEDLMSKMEAEEKPLSNKAGVTRKLERKSSRCSKSPGQLIEKKAAHSQESSTEEKNEKSEKGLWWNLSKVDKKKNSSKSMPKRGSSQSIVSAPVLAGKISAVFDKARGKKSKSEEEEPQSSNFARLDASTASLDLDLLIDSTSIQKVSHVDELFDEGEKDTSLRDQDNETVSESSSEDDNSYFKSNGIGATPNDGPSRVSWVELPLFDPQQLLMKSTDHDGANEMTELSGHVRSIDEWKDSSLKALGKALQENEEKKKLNPSLQATIGRAEEKRKKTGAQEERTVITTTTDSSESTAKTTNYIPSTKKPALSKAADKDLGTSQDSLTIDQFGTPLPEDHGSSGSLSRSSKRSKESKGSKSSKESKGSFKSDSSGSAGKTKTRHSAKSRQRSSERIRRSKDYHHRRKSEKRDTGKDDHPRSARTGDDAAKQRSGEKPTEDKAGEGTLPLKKRPSLERRFSNRSRAELTPKKSYLNKRKHLKSDKVDSQQAKKAVNSSLDTFLDRIEKAAPVVKDDNRSVYSSMQEKDRMRRSRDKKKKRVHSSRIKRQDSKRRTLGDLIGLDEGEHTDHDNTSVTSAPPLQYKTSSSSLTSKRHESQRPVVDLKKTQFSSKLNKLHVAF